MDQENLHEPEENKTARFSLGLSAGQVKSYLERCKGTSKRRTLNICLMRAEGYTQQDIADVYDVSQQCISGILCNNYDIWTELAEKTGIATRVGRVLKLKQYLRKDRDKMKIKDGDILASIKEARKQMEDKTVEIKGDFKVDIPE